MFDLKVYVLCVLYCLLVTGPLYTYHAVNGKKLLCYLLETEVSTNPQQPLTSKDVYP